MDIGLFFYSNDEGCRIIVTDLDTDKELYVGEGLDLKDTLITTARKVPIGVK